MLLLALTFLLAGFVVGGWLLPWNAHRVHVEDGVLYSRGFFESDYDEDFIDVDVGALWWTDGTSHGYGRPPCLRSAEAASVDAGVLWIDPPGSGGHDEVIWVKCR